MHKWLFLLSLLLCLACTRTQEKLEPQISYTVQDRYLKQLPSPFTPLNFDERAQDWGKEYVIGQHFASELDLYRAITAYRRAAFLISQDKLHRLLEIDYQILLCYYLGRRYEDVALTFTQTKLSQVTRQFPAYHDLLIILYDTYQQLGDRTQAEQILLLLSAFDEKAAEGLNLYSAMQGADLVCLQAWEKNSALYPCVSKVMDCYTNGKKSIPTAGWLNALMPGTGFLYLGQRQTAVTAFVVNGLFIAAAVQFFRHGYTAAGIITTSFEAGWYFGGIAGARQDAKLYNERLYERCVTPVMNGNGLFPVFMLQYAF